MSSSPSSSSSSAATASGEAASASKASTTSTSTSTSASASAGSMRERVELYATSLADAAPASVQPYARKAVPVLGQIAHFVELLLPHVLRLYATLAALYARAEPYRPDLLLPSLIGLVMCFFGGSYMTLIAAVEAYRMCGWESSADCLAMLYRDFEAIKAANDKDDVADADGDGVADVRQIAGQQLLARKAALFIKNADPARITGALNGLQAGFLAVVATLKLQFAKAVTLGTAIGEALEAPAFKYILPKLEASLPADYRKWAKPVLSYAIRSVAVSVAYSLQRVMSAFHSALRGGVLAARNLLSYLSAMDIYHVRHEDTYIDEAAGYALAALGLAFQLSMGFSIPFPLNLLLLPASFAEWALMYFISK